jgi:hypothetical protein
MSSKTQGHTWSNVRSFLDEKLKMLDGLAELTPDMSGDQNLTAKGAKSIKAAIEHQVDYMPFLKGVENEVWSEKINYAPISNLGAESDFAKVGNALKRTGGSTRLETTGNQHLISENKLFQRNGWKIKSENEKKKKWSWARNSDEAKQARQLQDNFLKKVVAAKALALKEKEKRKTHKNKRTTDALEKCKDHGGPVMEKDIKKI